MRSARGQIAHPWALDLADGQATEAVIEEVAEYFGGVDLLINNAGISIPHPLIMQTMAMPGSVLGGSADAHTALFALRCRGYANRKIRASSTLPLLRIGRDQVGSPTLRQNMGSLV